MKLCCFQTGQTVKEEYIEITTRYIEEWPSIREKEEAKWSTEAGEEGDEYDTFRHLVVEL